ncbi:MAG: DUF924 family protein [Kofleriaceae bacterium]
MDPRAIDVLEFWFGKEPIVSPELAKRWFVKDPAFDAEIKSRFGDLIDAAARGDLDDWSTEPTSALARIVVLDQFPRNVFRNDARSFATDAKALAGSRALIAAGRDRELTFYGRMFAYLPFEHAEDRATQAEGVAHYERLVADAAAANTPAPVRQLMDVALDFARKHAELIQTYGRFPHRNAVLGRASTAEEQEYLAKPGAGF